MSLYRERGRAARLSTYALAALLAGTTAAIVPAGPALAATWSVVSTPNATTFNNYLLGVDATSTTEAWAVGNASHESHPNIRPLALRWNGTAWSVVTTPTLPDYGGFAAVDGSAANNVWAVGSQENPTSGLADNSLVERWNGSAWSVVSSPAPTGATNYSLAGVKTLSTTDAWAVGNYSTSTAPTRRTLIQRWNGTSWSIVSSPNPHASSNLLADIDGVSGSDLWAVGSVGTGTSSAGLVQRWNGSAWSTVTIPDGPALSEIRLFDVVAVASNDVWVVGRAWHETLFNHVGYYLRWNGTSWQEGFVSGSGGFESVTALSATKVYAVGGDIFRWNGTAWSAESAASPGVLMDLAAVGTGTVWATGYQTVIGEFGPVNRTLAMRTTNG